MSRNGINGINGNWSDWLTNHFARFRFVRIMEEFSREKKDWARWSYRHVTSRSDYLLRYATRMPRQHRRFAGLALQSEGLNFPVILVARHTIARYSSSYLYFLYLEIDTKLWVKKYWKERERKEKVRNRDIETVPFRTICAQKLNKFALRLQN